MNYETFLTKYDFEIKRIQTGGTIDRLDIQMENRDRTVNAERRVFTFAIPVGRPTPRIARDRDEFLKQIFNKVSKEHR